MAMRKSSKVLVFVFFIVVIALVVFVNMADEAEIEALVDARVTQEMVIRENALEAEMAAREEVREAALAEREAELEERLAALDSARAALEEPIYRRVQGDDIEPVLRNMGLAFERDVDGDGDPKFSFKLATYNISLYFYGCTEEGCTSLRMATCFRMNEPPTVETINNWNSRKRFTTAYQDSDQRACIDTDLILKGGVTLGAVEAFIIQYRDLLNEYATHIGF